MRDPNDPRIDYLLGLDLGQTQDYSALAVCERTIAANCKPQYSIRHLQRFPLGTAYPAIIQQVVEIARTPPLQHAPLIVDQTGIGRAVVDMLRLTALRWVIPVTITAGQAVTKLPDGSYHVPKKELVTALQMLLQSRRLRVAESLPGASILVRELQNFRVKITLAANETFGAWREGDHDDLLLATALLAWWAESHPPSTADRIRSGDSFARQWDKYLR